MARFRVGKRGLPGNNAPRTPRDTWPQSSRGKGSRSSRRPPAGPPGDAPWRPGGAP